MPLYKNKITGLEQELTEEQVALCFPDGSWVLVEQETDRERRIREAREAKVELVEDDEPAVSETTFTGVELKATTRSRAKSTAKEG
jgi:hypothetical protein